MPKQIALDLDVDDRRGMGWVVVAVSLLLLMAIAVLALWTIRQDRMAAQFPNAQRISSHNNYSRLPRQFRWDDAYLITDADFRTVYTWYSLQFGTGPERQANGRCILLESSQYNWLFERRNIISLCDQPNGDTAAFINRTTIRR